MIRLAVLMVAVSLAACGQSVLGGDCDYTKNQRFVDTEGKEWVCRQVQTWTPAEPGLSKLDTKGGAPRGPADPAKIFPPAVQHGPLLLER